MLGRDGQSKARTQIENQKPLQIGFNSYQLLIMFLKPVNILLVAKVLYFDTEIP
jgi:hypothetical protein